MLLLWVSRWRSALWASVLKQCLRKSQSSLAARQTAKTFDLMSHSPELKARNENIPNSRQTTNHLIMGSSLTGTFRSFVRSVCVGCKTAFKQQNLVGSGNYMPFMFLLRTFKRLHSSIISKPTKPTSYEVNHNVTDLNLKQKLKNKKKGRNI